MLRADLFAEWVRSMKAFRWLLLFALFVAGVAYFFLRKPYGPRAETFVEIPAGTGTAGIASRLQQAGIVRSGFAFEVERRLRGGTLKAGEYRFDHPASVAEVYGRLEQGDVYTIPLTIPEGFNIFDIAAAVERAKLGTAVDFLAAEQHDTNLVAGLSPHARSLEGFLFPDTYRFSRHAKPRDMLAAMVRRFRQEAVRLALPGPPELVRVVTLASLVEKEVHVDAERPVVAGVFENRLALGMPLQTDPAVVYAALLDGRWRGTIYQSDLHADSPYNTYAHAGLPPGPVANPGVAALKAALHPAHTDFLYFVANADGTTQFSVDLKGHGAQVESYRQSLTSQGGSPSSAPRAR
jgi:UPF0755 protein